ncbi:prolyl oligopeptidase [Rhizomicrobium palustre]|uniref:prolyl oligopeptidase n=1 Tax=Rhizomicrobium palustre TaxID=189966 RepID=A0A846N2H9_9PROT|nr:prolyl oligopeptidase family serine peptidase [Rhizomicrobium palustre]NIK89695.1 prolyl oligopeptidase [Rhizomicrobium palustre]
MSMNRRQWLGVMGVAMGSSFLPALGAELKPPVAKVLPVKDTYFGETLTDPYRWMENDKDPDWLPFLKGQNAYTRSILDHLPGRDALLKRIVELSGDSVQTADLQRAGGKLFFEQRVKGADNFKLFLRENGKDRVLIDPTAIHEVGVGHFSLDWWTASPNGKYIAYGISKDGSEDSVLHILDVDTGKELSETIANTEGANPQWLEDSSGFFYNQLTGKVATPERYLDSQARFHKLGSDPASDPILMKRGLDPKVVFENIQAPTIATAHGSKYALLFLSDVRPEARLFIAPLADVLAGKAKWVQVADFEDVITGVDLHGDTLYLISSKDAPRGKLIKLSASAPSLAKAVEVVPQQSTVLLDIARAKDGLYLRILDGGIYHLARLDDAGKVTPIALPFDGTVGHPWADPTEDGIYFNLSGWLNPTGVWRVDAKTAAADTGLNPPQNIDVSGYETKHAFATAKDGTKIPYHLIYRKGLKLDGSHPLFIQAYGSYGSAAYTPNFAGRLLALIDQGAVVGFAGVRGGGEYGREWHKAGQLENKPNTWRDLIAVCEELIALKYTAKEHLAIGGRSAGGITVGRAMTERPDLFAAVVGGVGWFNPLRYVAEQNGYGEEPEWGAIREEKGYRALKSIDSYHAVKDGTKYPAALLTTGVSDPRVAPFHVGKMAARLQAATASGKPILLRVDFDAGHGIGSTRSQADQEAADTYAFLLWQTK